MKAPRAIAASRRYTLLTVLAMTPQRILLLVSLLSLAACDADPRHVYIPLTEPEVELVARASAVEVSVGEPVVLYAERWYRGEWNMVTKRDLPAEQCWMRSPPLRYEKEVADNVRWVVHPAEGATFNIDLRADRTREVIFKAPGTYTLEPHSAIWCQRDEVAKGNSITIVVRDVGG